MITGQARFNRRILPILWASALATAAGCGGLKLVPVAGTVTAADGKPLQGGAVCFSPDASKGNQARVSCRGRIDSHGHYALSTSAVQGADSGKGAPLGWYKVTLITTLPGAPEIKVDSQYLDPEKTPLSIEVVADPAPNAYDIKLTK
jgi:hypothetical protein